MAKTPAKRRLEAPWSIEETPSGFRVTTKNGIHICYVYAGVPYPGYSKWAELEHGEARKVARAIARLPELMRPPSSSGNRSR